MKLDYKPDGIVITISQKMLQEKGYRNWLKNFLEAMAKEEWLYYMRQGSQPKHGYPLCILMHWRLHQVPRKLCTVTAGARVNFF